jgi:hypothetical protein
MDPQSIESTSAAAAEAHFAEVVTEFHSSAAHIASLPDIADRAFHLNELGELCYMNPDLMLQSATVRRRLFREFEAFFSALKNGAVVNLDLRDQVNRLYGMLLEMRSWLEKDPRCQF